MPLLDNAQWLSDMLGSTDGVALTYTRGATVITITAASGYATVGREEVSSDRDRGTRKEWRDRDYLIQVAALTELGEPAEGDLITETINGTVRKFKVMRPDTGDKAWRYSDTEELTYRLHTKRVG